MEAITNRALLLASVGKAVKHAGQTTLYLTPMHAAVDKLQALIANIRIALSHVKAVAQRLPRVNRWKTFVVHVGLWGGGTAGFRFTVCAAVACGGEWQEFAVEVPSVVRRLGCPVRR